MDKVHEVIKQLVEKGDFEALSSEEALEKALLEQGCSKEEIEDVLSEFVGFPLDDDDIEAITGGGPMSRGGFQKDITKLFNI